MRTVSGSPRIVKRKLADGDVSFTFSVCQHVRVMGRPNHIDLAKIGTFRRSDFDNVAGQFWKIVDAELTALVNKNILWNADRKKCENAFAKHIPRPVPAAAKTDEPQPDESNLETINRLIAEVGNAAIQKLKAEHDRIL